MLVHHLALLHLSSHRTPSNARNTQHATRNTQHATRNTQHAARNTQHAARSTQHTTSNNIHINIKVIQYNITLYQKDDQQNEAVPTPTFLTSILRTMHCFITLPLLLFTAKVSRNVCPIPSFPYTPSSLSLFSLICLYSNWNSFKSFRMVDAGVISSDGRLLKQSTPSSHFHLPFVSLSFLVVVLLSFPPFSFLFMSILFNDKLIEHSGQAISRMVSKCTSSDPSSHHSTQCGYQ